MIIEILEALNIYLIISRSGGSMGMIAIVGRVVRNERIFGLWKGVTPVSRFLLYLDRVLTFEKNKLGLIYVK